MDRLHVEPRQGLKVRHPDGTHMKPEPQWVPASTYYRRRVNAKDLVEVSGDPPSFMERLVDAVHALDPNEPSHFTDAGAPSLNHLKEALGTRVTREQADEALAIIAKQGA